MYSLKRVWHIGLCMVLLAGSCTVSDPGPKGEPVVTDAEHRQARLLRPR